MSANFSLAHEDHISLEEASPARILLVDDLEANLLALGGLLRRDDVKLLHAHSGREALELLLAEEVALAIIDVQMPVMNGFELAELMRGAERTRQIPIIFITAGTQDEQHRFRGYDAGAVDFLYKPIEPDILRQKVAVFLALYRSRRKIIQQRDELLRREAALRDSEQMFHLAVEAAPNGMIVANRRGEIILANSATEKLFGYSREELIGKPVEMLVPDRFRESHPQDREGFCNEPQLRPMGGGRDLYGRRKDGSEFPVEIGLNPMQTDREMLILGSVVDITESRESEATRRLLASVVESSVDGIISEDLDGVITSWNSGAKRMFGYSADEMIGRTISVMIPPGHVNETPMVLERIKRGEPIQMYETVRQVKNGNLITVSITWSPIHDANGRILGVSKIVRDVTQRKQMEEQRLKLIAKERALASERALRETEAELARVVRALSVGELATSIAHEINQPLAGVVTNAEAGLRWLSGAPPNIQEARESLGLIARDGNRASEVIRRIREFLRKGQQETTLLHINDVVQDAAGLARPELLKRKVTLRLGLMKDIPQVQGDRIQLQQVVLNLIMNGAEAMSSLERTRELHVTSQNSGDGGVVIAVRDSGVGISPQDMARMFDPLFTTKPTGMGMGLSISRTIIEAHGGRIWADLNDDHGLTVRFGLPAEALSYAASNPS